MLWTEIVDNRRNNPKPRPKEKLLISYQLNHTIHKKTEQTSLNKEHFIKHWKIREISFNTWFKKLKNRITKTTIPHFKKQFIF